MANKNLNAAKEAKKDEFYTQLEDINNELRHYKEHFRGRTSGDLRDLSFRTFDKKQKREAYERQGGICPWCGNHFELEEMDADHVTAWSKGGSTDITNCQMLCKTHNRSKGNR